jgi:hypothetical protein
VTGPEPGTADAEQVLAQRRATMFATLGFNVVVRVPPGMETRRAAGAEPGRSSLLLDSAIS